MSFSTHLHDTIQLNRARRPHYARSSGGRSLVLSNLLIGLEWMSLPAALHLERRAAAHPRRQELLERSFVPIRGRSSPTPPRLRSGPSRV
ncbi:MAG: hypothetical protein GY913_00470 [Proteobacteria bacterium]|nr:hypothetical protein [Pseudomonadota bacterium]MCP4915371.1 hypothetical protein [Pseudomonadota bacterium]